MQVFIKLEDAEMRELECELAKVAIRSVLIEWGMGWFSLSKEQREAALLCAITQYASGHTITNNLKKWGKIKELNITATPAALALVEVERLADSLAGHNVGQQVEDLRDLLESVRATVSHVIAVADSLQSEALGIGKRCDASEVPRAVHESGWQWRPGGKDTAFAPPFGTVRVCRHCGCLVTGGVTACARCAGGKD